MTQETQFSFEGISRLSVAMTNDVARELSRHLDRPDGQEDICFVLWRPSTGASRLTALVYELVLPNEGDRHVHGNASFEGQFFLRAASLATATGSGVGLIHSHPGGLGWQRMSTDDAEAERSHAAQALAITGHPLLGMTLGTGDNHISARFWERVGPRAYEPRWCETVRSVGDHLEMSYNPALRPPPTPRPEQLRTISAWGQGCHDDLVRSRVGIVGAGSVGAIVAEALARTGVEDLTLLDFDSVKPHNLDRLLHATRADADARRAKVSVLAAALTDSSTAAEPAIHALELSVVEDLGFKSALDCDVLFSCVDRPWARAVLNLIAYAHLIPVIDGGIAVRSDGRRLRGAEWRAHVASPSRRCLECLGQYDPAMVQTERNGLLDDPSYLLGLPEDSPLRRNENVFAFSAGCAAAMVIQFITFAVAPGGVSDVGAQLFHLTTGKVDIDTRSCEPDCLYATGQLAMGDHSPLRATGTHLLADAERAKRAAL